MRSAFWYTTLLLFSLRVVPCPSTISAVSWGLASGSTSRARSRITSVMLGCTPYGSV